MQAVDNTVSVAQILGCLPIVNTEHKKLDDGLTYINCKRNFLAAKQKENEWKHAFVEKHRTEVVQESNFSTMQMLVSEDWSDWS